MSKKTKLDSFLEVGFQCSTVQSRTAILILCFLSQAELKGTAFEKINSVQVWIVGQRHYRNGITIA